MSLASAVRPWTPSNRSWLTRAFSGARNEGVAVVEALADVDPGPEQVLVELRDGVGVDVEADVAGVDPREPCPARAGRRGLEARLHDRVAGDHPPRPRVGLGLVQRV